MKYFKNINNKKKEKKPEFGYNESELWNRIVKLFATKEGYKQQMTTSIEQVANNLRNFEYQKYKEENDREFTHKNPRLEDNSDDTNYGENYEKY